MEILNSSVGNNFTHMFGKDATVSDLLPLTNVSMSVSFKHASVSEVRFVFEEWKLY